MATFADAHRAVSASSVLAALLVGLASPADGLPISLGTYRTFDVGDGPGADVAVANRTSGTVAVLRNTTFD